MEYENFGHKSDTECIFYASLVAYILKNIERHMINFEPFLYTAEATASQTEKILPQPFTW